LTILRDYAIIFCKKANFDLKLEMSMIFTLILAVLIIAGLTYVFASDKAEPVRVPIRTKKGQR